MAFVVSRSRPGKIFESFEVWQLLCLLHALILYHGTIRKNSAHRHAGFFIAGVV